MRSSPLSTSSTWIRQRCPGSRVRGIEVSCPERRPTVAALRTMLSCRTSLPPARSISSILSHCQYCVPHTIVSAMSENFESHRQELRRGTAVLACLQLLRTPGYGYGLLEDLARHGFPTDGNTLYPLLRRLEKQGLLTSEWNTEEARPRKFYRTS